MAINVTVVRRRVQENYYKPSVTVIGGNSTLFNGMQYLKYWQPISYAASAIVYDGRWTMISNVETDERAAPQRIGDEEIIYDGISDVDTSISVVQLLYGIRYVPSYNGYIENYRLQVTAGQVYDIRIIKDSLGAEPEEIYIETFQAETTEVKDFGFIPFFFQTGETFDLIVKVSGGGAPETVSTYQYNYLIGDFTLNPVNGQIVHYSSTIKISVIDAYTNDLSVFLSSLAMGDKIAIEGTAWNILGKAPISEGGFNSWGFIVSPVANYKTEGLQAVNFTKITASSLVYNYENDKWLGNANVRGIAAADGDYESAIINDDAYGIHLTLQQADYSLDWDFVARSSKSPSPYIKHTEENVLTEVTTHTVTVIFKRPFSSKPMEIKLQVYRMELQPDNSYQRQNVPWGYSDALQPTETGFAIKINQTFTPDLTGVILDYKFEEV